MGAKVIEELDTQYYPSIKRLMTHGFFLQFNMESLEFYAGGAFQDRDKMRKFFEEEYNDMDDPDQAEILWSVLDELEKKLIAPLTDDNVLVETGYDDEREQFFIRMFTFKDIF